MGCVLLQDIHGWFSFVHCVCAEGGEGEHDVGFFVSLVMKGVKQLAK